MYFGQQKGHTMLEKCNDISPKIITFYDYLLQMTSIEYRRRRKGQRDGGGGRDRGGAGTPGDRGSRRLANTINADTYD
ncbi:hypothetical protein [Candidatus Nitrosocosmicus sp. T]